MRQAQMHLCFDHQPIHLRRRPGHRQSAMPPTGHPTCPATRRKPPGLSPPNSLLPVVPPARRSRMRGGSMLGDLDSQALTSKTAHTILLVEVAHPGIDWTEPKDVSLDAIAAADPNSPALVPSSNHDGSLRSNFSRTRLINTNLSSTNDSSRPEQKHRRHFGFDPRIAPDSAIHKSSRCPPLQT